jgi:GPH family glycoside/pentoside/hexuronide:cation symporter
MSENKTAPEDLVPFGKKMAFSSGHLAIQLYPAAMSVFMVILVVSLKMDPLLAGLLAALPRIFDAIIDPVMGYISDNTHTRWGRRRPYIFIGAIINAIAFVAMWQIYPENGQSYNFVYFLILSFAFYLGNTMFAAPLMGWTYELTPDFHERTRVIAVTQFVGQTAWIIAPWLWVIVYMPDLYPSAPEASRNIALIFGLLCMVLGVIPAIFCKERVIPNVTDKKVTIKGFSAQIKEFIGGIAQTFKYKTFKKLCAATFLIFNGYQIVSQFAFFIIVYYLFQGNVGAAGVWPAWFGTVASLATIILVIPIVTYLSKKFGKKNAFIIATAISIVGYCLKWWGFNPANPYLMLLPLPLISFGIGGLFTLMMSMTADVCDLDELTVNKRREGTFGAVYWWMVKLGNGLAMLFSGAVLKWAGFDEALGAQTADTITKLRIADIAIPATTALLAIIIMWKYKLTETDAREIRKRLEERRGKVVAEI